MDTVSIFCAIETSVSFLSPIGSRCYWQRPQNSVTASQVWVFLPKPPFGYIPGVTQLSPVGLGRGPIRE